MKYSRKIRVWFHLTLMIIHFHSNFSMTNNKSKSDIEECSLKENQHNLIKETCRTQLDYKKSRRKERTPDRKCVIFDHTNFNKTSPSVVIMDANGGTGNQLFAYAILYQLRYLYSFS